jgi:hypothetical protein
MNLKEALKLHRFEVMKRRGLLRKDPQINYQRLNYHAYERHVSLIEKQNERMIAAVEKISNKQAEPAVDRAVTSRPNERDYASFVGYTRALEAYCDLLEQAEPGVESMLRAGRFCDANCTAMDHHPDCQIGNPSF